MQLISLLAVPTNASRGRYSFVARFDLGGTIKDVSLTGHELTSYERLKSTAATQTGRVWFHAGIEAERRYARPAAWLRFVQTMLAASDQGQAAASTPPSRPS